MTHIAMRREDERGEFLAEFESSGIDPRIVASAPSTSCCLRFIDSDGDTIINQLQLPVLISELMQLREVTHQLDLRNQIKRVVAFLRDSDDVHVYVRFVGD